MNQAEDCDTDTLRAEYTAGDFAGFVRGKYAGKLAQRGATIAIACEQLADGRWHAYLAAQSSVQAYADTRDGAVEAVMHLALIAADAQRAPDDALRTAPDVILIEPGSPELPFDRRE